MAQVTITLEEFKEYEKLLDLKRSMRDECVVLQHYDFRGKPSRGFNVFSKDEFLRKFEIKSKCMIKLYEKQLKKNEELENENVNLLHENDYLKQQNKKLKPKGIFAWILKKCWKNDKRH